MANAKRVRWLERAYKLLREEYLQDAPAKACVSVSVTTTKRAIGQHFSSYRGVDGHHFIAVHPCLFNDPPKVLKVLLHEMIHAVVPLARHGKPFQAIAKAVGFTSPWTQTPATEGLAKKLEKLAEKLGKLPKAEWLTGLTPAAAMVTIECVCPRTLVISQDFLKSGNIKCMKCRKLFRRKLS